MQTFDYFPDVQNYLTEWANEIKKAVVRRHGITVEEDDDSVVAGDAVGSRARADATAPTRAATAGDDARTLGGTERTGKRFVWMLATGCCSSPLPPVTRRAGFATPGTNKILATSGTRSSFDDQVQPSSSALPWRSSSPSARR